MPELLETQEPHFELLKGMYLKEKHRRTKQQIFERWAKKILPEEPTLSFIQFRDWTGRFSDTEIRIADAQKADIELIEKGRGRTIVQLEGQLRRVVGKVLDEAERIMDENEEETLPLKERYLAVGIVKDVWGRITKEKEIAIKAHAEKRESVGMFAKLMEKAQAGEITMEEVERLTQQSHEHIIEGGAIAQPETT